MASILATLRVRERAPFMAKGSMNFSWLASSRMYSRVADRIDVPDSNAYSCAYNYESNEGRYLAVGTEAGNVLVLDTKLQKGENVCVVDSWHAHDNNILDIQWSKDDRYIATTSGDSKCRLFDVSSKRCVADLKGHEQSVRTFDFSPHDPNVLATGSRDGSVMLWDVRCSGVLEGEYYVQSPIMTIQKAHIASTVTEPKKRSSKKIPSGNQINSVTAVRFVLHDKSLLASAGATDGIVKYWDIRKPSSQHGVSVPVQCSTPPSGIRVKGLCTLTFSPDGDRIYTACMDNRIHEYASHVLTSPMRTFTSATLKINFYVKTAASPDGGAIACASADGTVQVFGLRKAAPTVLLKGHEKGTSSVDWCKTSPDQLASCADDRVVRVWNSRDPISDLEEETGLCEEDMGDEVPKHWIGRAEVLVAGVTALATSEKLPVAPAAESTSFSTSSPTTIHSDVAQDEHVAVEGVLTATPGNASSYPETVASRSQPTTLTVPDANLALSTEGAIQSSPIQKLINDYFPRKPNVVEASTTTEVVDTSPTTDQNSTYCHATVCKVADLAPVIDLEPVQPADTHIAELARKACCKSALGTLLTGQDKPNNKKGTSKCVSRPFEKSRSSTMVSQRKSGNDARRKSLPTKCDVAASPSNLPKRAAFGSNTNGNASATRTCLNKSASYSGSFSQPAPSLKRSLSIKDSRSLSCRSNGENAGENVQKRARVETLANPAIDYQRFPHGICGCGCHMVDEDICQCLAECSTLQLKGKGCDLAAEESQLLCIDFGGNKENICAFHLQAWNQMPENDSQTSKQVAQ
ncbi:WD40-repeat-containing domain protein [Chytriomyces sp. MP71]|nr:WD40-repeat-containing domain protein [Chytriomyces sp. MP71]